MNFRRNGAKPPVFSTSITCKDEKEMKDIQAYLTRDGRSIAGSITSMIRTAMNTNAAVLRGSTNVDIDVIRRNQMTGASHYE